MAVNRYSSRTLGTSILGVVDRVHSGGTGNSHASLLQQCGNAKNLSEGQRIHAQIIRDGHDQNRFLGNLLIQMYGNCGSVLDARRVFEGMQRRNSFSWNIVIVAHVQNGQLREARGLFDKMPQWDVVSWTAAFTAYARKGYLREAKSLFDSMPQRDVVSWNGMIAAYAQNGDLQEARSIFDRIPQRTVISWTPMIAGFAETGHLQEAREIFDKVPQRNVITWNAMVTAYAQNGNLQEARIMFDEMVQRNVVSWNAIVTAYAQYGHLQEARCMFEKMTEWNVVSWNTMLTAYAQYGHLQESRSIFDNITERDVVSWTTMIGAYAQNSQLQEAKNIFDQMQHRDVVTWNAMFVAYAQNGDGENAIALFRRMDIEGIAPDKVTWINILDVCGCFAALTEGKILHAEIMDNASLLDDVVGSALITMLGKCGNLEDARNLLDAMPRSDAVPWNCMVAAYAENGEFSRAFKLFGYMSFEGVPPDSITFVHILSCCSHAGLVSKGCTHFVSMVGDYHIEATVEHYVCMVDLLGRSGQLADADDLINNMPFQPHSVAWRTLLGACRIQGNVDHGSMAAAHIVKLEPGIPSPYVLLSNMYADDKAKLK